MSNMSDDPTGSRTIPQAAVSVPADTRPPGQPAVMIEGLTKRFGPKVAVDNLTMWVPRGSMFGFVGPNGAGKTTTLSMVTGLLRPDAGRVEVLGHDVWADPAAAKAQMGVLPDGMKTFDRLSGRELLRFCGMLHRLDEATINERAEGLLDALSLTSAADLLVCDYSAGMTKKIDLACAIIADPAVLVLDEPSNPSIHSGQTIRSILRRFVDGGGTVVISSHVMELVESLCDSVAVIAGDVSTLLVPSTTYARASLCKIGSSNSSAATPTWGGSYVVAQVLKHQWATTLVPFARVPSRPRSSDSSFWSSCPCSSVGTISPMCGQPGNSLSTSRC